MANTCRHFTLAAILAGAATLHAQPAANSATENVEELEGFNITASAFDRPANELSQAWSLIDETKLNRIRSSSLGDTLGWQPGISSTQFTAGATRPVIRGLEGQRVRILSNGTGSLDMSNTSPDHAVTIDPMHIQQVEILRGPANLLYGGSAIGGVVNVVDGRIASSIPGEATGAFSTKYESVSDGKFNGFNIDIPYDNLVIHFDGTHREAGDYEVPSFSPEDGDPKVETVENSFHDSRDFALGLTRLFEGGHLAFVFNHTDSTYGVLTEDGHAPFIDLEQRQFLLDGNWAVDGSFIRSIKGSYSFSDYEHGEYEEPGELHTAFEMDSHETRWEFEHQQIGSFEGIFGLQLNFDEMATPVEESIFAGNNVDNVDSVKSALFIVEEKELSEQLRWEVGGRVENTDYEVSGTAPAVSDRDFTTFSASTALVYDMSADYTVTGNIAYSGRAPSMEELYSNGLHEATESFTIGDDSLEEEESLGFDIALRKKTGAIRGELAFFTNHFDNFIYQAATGREVTEDGTFPVPAGGEGLVERQYVGVDAEFYGFELALETTLFEDGDTALSFRPMADFIRAKNESNDSNLPRIAPFRIGGELEYSTGQFVGTIEVRHALEQDDFSPFEDETPDYTLLNLRAAYTLFVGENSMEIFAEANNVTDELAYVSSSFRKEKAPLPGRSFNIGLNYRF